MLFFFKQKTAYEMRISDWSSDVCSSDLWRGIGSSDRRAGRRCDWGYRELLHDDLPAGMAALRERWPQARCWLGGHSLGGQLSLLFASLHPTEFAGLLLVASGSPYWRRFRHGWLIGVAYVLSPFLAGWVGAPLGRGSCRDKGGQ